MSRHVKANGIPADLLRILVKLPYFKCSNNLLRRSSGISLNYFVSWLKRTFAILPSPLEILSTDPICFKLINEKKNVLITSFKLSVGRYCEVISLAKKQLILWKTNPAYLVSR